MADILRSQPVAPGFENAPVRNQPLTPQDGAVQNAPNPSRVMNPDGKTEREDGRFELLSNSNYESFIRELKDSQGLTQAFANVLFTNTKVRPGEGDDELLGRLSGFMELITMEEEDLLPFIQNQAARTTEFGEPFFRVMKDVFDETTAVPLKTAILRAAGKYGDLASANHTMRTILTELKGMLPQLFASDKGSLQDMIGKLTVLQGPYPKAGTELFAVLEKSFESNKQVLLKELIPFFSSYIKRTHDMGAPRERMRLITDQAARYLNGNPEETKELFTRLLTYGEVGGRMGGVTADNLVLILGSLLRKRLEGEDNQFANEFSSLIKAGLKSGDKEAFSGIMNSMLRNDSVYLPLFHLMVPVRLGSSTLLSELWVDPDDSGNGGNEKERGIRLLMRLEIQGLGAFDLVIHYLDRQVELRILYPPALRGREREIRTAVGAIAVENGMTPKELQTEIRRAPLKLTDVFPKIKDRKDTVNVRV